MIDEKTWRDACCEAQRGILADVASGNLGSSLESFKRGDISARDFASGVSAALVRLNVIDYIQEYSNSSDVRAAFDEKISERGLEMKPEALPKLIVLSSLRQFCVNYNNNMEDFTERARPFEADFEVLAGTAPNVLDALSHLEELTDSSVLDAGNGTDKAQNGSRDPYADLSNTEAYFADGNGGKEAPEAVADRKEGRKNPAEGIG